MCLAGAFIPFSSTFITSNTVATHSYCCLTVLYDSYLGSLFAVGFCFVIQLIWRKQTGDSKGECKGKYSKYASLFKTFQVPLISPVKIIKTIITESASGSSKSKQ